MVHRGGKVTAGGGREKPRRQCTAPLLCMLTGAALPVLVFLAYAAFFPDGGAGGVSEQWWRLKAHAARLGQSLSHEAAEPTTLEHIVFGIGSSAQMWGKRCGYTELWWRPEQMRGKVWLDKEPEGPLPETIPPYRLSPDTSRFGTLADVSRLARIVADSFLAVNGTASGREVRWFVVGDDDTVFFPDNLVAVLRKYDHEEMYYIGAPSESVEQDLAFNYGMAFGGGGIAVSYPAAAALAGAIDGCLHRYRALLTSDHRVHACLSELGVPVTREPGFHQLDIRGDASGLLAAHPVAPLVSLHHLDKIDPILPQSKTALDAVQRLVGAARLDPARTLQRSICYHQHGHGAGHTWSISVAWGYAVQLYPWAVAPHELEVPLQTFKTFGTNADGPFLFNTRSVRSNDACALPLTFFLVGARNDDTGGATVTEYARHAAWSGKECDEPGFRAASAVQSVRVLAPTMSLREWQRAPRRHCCTVERTADHTGCRVMPVSGASMNPARTVGPAIVGGEYRSIWVYIVGPVVGAVAGAWAYNLIRFTNKPLREITRSTSFLKSNLSRMNSTV
ncbi:hypothetical protein ACP4OV_009225 [Aristida adscensionis]